MKNALLKSQYRLEQLRDDAQAVADKLFSFVLPESVLNGEAAIVEAGGVAARAIVERNAERVIRAAVELVSERQSVDIKTITPMVELLAGRLADVFIREMEWTGTVCLGDTKQWADKALVMGSDRGANVATVNRAYNEGSPPLFADHDKRVRQAIAAWHNALFQGTLTIAQGASV
jgi:hypothetical protein